MVRSLRPSGLILAMMAFSLVPGIAQEPSRPLVAAWAELDGSLLGGEYPYTTVLFPRELMRALDFVQERYPSTDEFYSGLEKDRASALETARNAVATARKHRDLVAITVRDHDKRASELATADEAIQKAATGLADTIARIESQRRAGETEQENAGATSAKVSLDRWAGHSTGTLVDASRDPAATCESGKIDILVYGSAEIAGNFMAIDIRVYVASIGKIVWQGREYAPPDGLDSAIEALTRPVAEAIMGHPYARTAYRVTPAQAELLVDGKPIAGRTGIFLEEGVHELMVTSEGYKPASQSFHVQPGTDLDLELDLEANSAVSFGISSDPPGASIFIDGMRSGLTPVEVEGADYPRVSRLSLDGYRDIQIIVRPDNLLEDIHVSMVPSDGSSFNEHFDSGKGRFYRALGWFVSSLPATVMAGGLFQVYYSASTTAYEQYGASLDPQIENRLNLGFYSTQAAFWVSAAASIGFAVNAVIQLAAYLGSTR